MERRLKSYLIETYQYLKESYRDDTVKLTSAVTDRSSNGLSSLDFLKTLG